MDRLLAEKHEVLGFDNFIIGRAENLAHLTAVRRFRFEQDVSQPFRFGRGRRGAALRLARQPSRLSAMAD